MSGRSIAPIGSLVFESLKLHFSPLGEVRFEGTLANEKSRLELKRRLAEIHERIVSDGLRTVTVDVRALKFVDSSAIRLFIDWVSLASEAHYKLEFVVDRTITWQRLSFSVLKSMEPEFVEIREKDAAAGTSTRPIR